MNWIAAKGPRNGASATAVSQDSHAPVHRYRPGEICKWDLWETSEHVPVGHGQTRRAWVVVCCPG